MPLFPAHDAVFVHVPKTGGQAILASLGCSYATADLFGLAGAVELSHMSAAEIRAAAPAAYDGARLRFAFVRDPWDRAVSEFYYTAGAGAYMAAPAPDFPAFVEAIAALDPAAMPHGVGCHLRTQSSFLDAPGGPPLDFVGRYERFAADVSAVRERLGLPPAEVPLVNASRRPPVPYAAHYTPRLAGIVGRIYAVDVERLGYRFRPA